MPKAYKEPPFNDSTPATDLVPVRLTWPGVEVHMHPAGPDGEPMVEFWLPNRPMHMREALQALGFSDEELCDNPDVERLGDDIAALVQAYDLRRLFARAKRHY